MVAQIAWVGVQELAWSAEDMKMGDASVNPIYVGLLCIARCLVPLLILFGISYLLRRFGVISKPTPPPEGYQNSEDNGY